MKNNDTPVSRNTLAFIGLAGEYCSVIEKAGEMQREDFVKDMVRLLPRMYIAISDHKVVTDEDMKVIGTFVTEDQYESVRSTVASLMGEDDTYLETFEEDMKYSDTPIAVSVSEALTDIYQDICNFMITIRSSEGLLATQVMDELYENFILYWSAPLCNVMRPLNRIAHEQ